MRFFQKLRQISDGMLINQLMKIYGFLVLTLCGMIGLGLSIYTVSNTYQKAGNDIDIQLEELTSSVRSQNQITLRLVEQLTAQSEDYMNMHNYLTLSPSEYFTTVIKQWHEGSNVSAFSNTLRNSFKLYPEIVAIDITLNDGTSYLHADRSYNTGRMEDGKLHMMQNNYLLHSLRNPDTGEVAGQLYVSFEAPVSPSNMVSDFQMSRYIFDAYGRLLYAEEGAADPHAVSELSDSLSKSHRINLGKLSSNYDVKYTWTDDLLTVVLLPKAQLRILAVQTFLLYGLSTVLVSGLLLAALIHLFKKYINQVSLITDALDQVVSGDLSVQIDTNNMKMELYDISKGINQMLVNINQSINEIYALEVKQRDANMRALQSQINPHFLYNTLEYIRMYALSRQQEELSEVIYAFASLLRNNISQDKTTQLKDELAFCEKYIYLYQMRYPESFAYHVYIDREVENLEIPKFIIQPLVENYFIHGIDHTRQDNAISIKVLKTGKTMQILIKDNGKGMTPERLQQVSEEVKAAQFNKKESIGLQNVYLRLVHYFGEKFRWELETEERKGLTIRIFIEQDSDKK